MSESLADLLVLAFSCAALFGVAGIGVLALPWKDDELAATNRAVRHAWRRLDDALRLAIPVDAPKAPRRAVRPLPGAFDAPSVASVAFERPSLPV